VAAGEFKAGVFNLEEAAAELQRLDPAEILVPSDLSVPEPLLARRPVTLVGPSGGAAGLLIPEAHEHVDAPILVNLGRLSLTIWQELERTRGLRFESRSEFWNDEARIREQVAFVRPEDGRDDGRIERHDFVVVVLWGEHGVRGERTYASEAFHRLVLGDDYFHSLRPLEA